MSELGTLRNICQVSCRMFFNGSVSGFFIMAGVTGLWAEDRVKMLFSPHRVKGACCQHDGWPPVVLLVIWFRQCLLGVWKVSLSHRFSYRSFQKEVTVHWKRPWCWEGLGAGGEGDDRELDGWMASLTPWAWVWGNSGSWWWTGRAGVLRFMGSQRVGHDWATELNWTELFIGVEGRVLLSWEQSVCIISL